MDPLATDLYELTMAASYLRQGMDATATFSLFVRELPASRGFLAVAGIEEALDCLASFRFDQDHAEVLRRLGVPELAGLRFTGDVWAVPEGRVVLAEEPLLEVSAPVAEAQVVETALLNRVTFRTALLTKAARCRLAAGDDAPRLVDFSLRRTHGVEAGMAVARAAAVAGFAGTSNVAAAEQYGIAALGTMAHSYVEAFADEAEAFATFAGDFPEHPTFLVDTYDIDRGVQRAIEVATKVGLPPERVAVRLDSGDLAAGARRIRGRLDAAGFRAARIVVSGGIDEHDIAALVTSGAPVDGIGVGTRLGVSADAPALDSVYKLVQYGDRPVLKLSEGKRTMPGPKQVFRGPGTADVLACRDEPAPAGTQPLLVPVMRSGRRLGPPDTVDAARERLAADLAALPPGARDLRTPTAPRPAVSAVLTARTEVAEKEARG